VIGPAQDGGYYLIGLTRPVPEIFKNKAWGTNSVLTDTLANLGNTKTALLPVLNDIDLYEDIEGNPVFEPFLKKTK